MKKYNASNNIIKIRQYGTNNNLLNEQIKYHVITYTNIHKYLVLKQHVKNILLNYIDSLMMLIQNYLVY